ncbi:MAG: DUF3835 domain-containing protein, partial [Bacteroidota bacterium]
MRTTIYLLPLLAIAWSMTSCATNENSVSMEDKTIMEVTTFSIGPSANPADFANLDAQVEANFTSKRPGFISRQSGINEEGNYAVVVYWENMADADASMSKFMDAPSVSDYTKMIDASTMNMSRYAVDKPLEANDSRFVEIMSFDVKDGENMEEFNATNQEVETQFTGTRDGFIQRLTGVNEAGQQVVAVYWENKVLSDASLEPFMIA